MEENYPTKTLHDLRRQLDAPHEGYWVTERKAREVYNTAFQWMEMPALPPADLSFAIKIISEALDILIRNLSWWESIKILVCYGLLATEILARRMENAQSVEEDEWEEGIVVALHYAANWKVDFPSDSVFSQSPTLKQWVFKMLQSAEFCPKMSLRLETLTFVSMWSREECMDPINMGEVMHGLIAICSIDNMNYLLPSQGPTRLLSHFVQVLMTLQRWGHMDVVTQAAIEQAAINHVGPETMCLLQISELAGKAAIDARNTKRNRRWGSQYTLHVFGSVMAIFSVLFMTAPIEDAFRGECLAESAAASLVTATRCILSCIPEGHPEDMEDYVYILTVADVIIYNVNTAEKLRSIRKCMHVSHHYTLTDLYEHAKFIGYPFRKKLTKKHLLLNEDCPER